MIDFHNLPEVQTEIIKTMISKQPNRPKRFDFQDLYKELDYSKFTEEDAESGLRELVEVGVFSKREDGTYQFSRNHYFEARRRFRFQILFAQTNALQLASLVIAMGATVVTMAIAIPTVYESMSFERLDDQPAIETLSIRNSTLQREIEDLIGQIREQESRLNAVVEIPDERKSALAIKELQDDVTALQDSVDLLTGVIAQDPTKVLEVSLLRSEVTSIQEQQDERYLSLSRELDRVSSYNTTIIAFMITFLVALLGFGIFNIVRGGRSDK